MRNNLIFVVSICRHAVCIFYLVLRALDTVEDDMTIPMEEKTELLVKFYTKLEDPDWTYDKSQEKDKIVLQDFTCVSFNQVI